MEYRTKQDQVAEILRERIIVGEYERGRKLPQLEIAEELGVSATPVREALRILEAEGYVIGLSHRGVLVPPFNVDQSQELFELRLLLEIKLTRDACRNLEPDTLAKLHDLQNEFADAAIRRDRSGQRRTNYRFHFNLYELAKQPQTLQFVRVLWAKYPFHYLDAIKSRAERVSEEHLSFLDKLDRGDLDGAAHAMEEHIRAGWNEFASQQMSDITKSFNNSRSKSA